MRKLLTTTALTLAGMVAMPTAYADGEDTLTISGKYVVVEGVVGRQVAAVSNQLLQLTAGIGESTDKNIDIIIDSPGGSVFAGMQFINAMGMAKARGANLRCIVTRMAASMAFQFLAHCDNRYVFPYSLLLWHPVAMSTGFGMRLTPDFARALAEDLSRMEDILVTDLRNYLNLPDEIFWKHYYNETLHFGSEVDALTGGDYLTVITNVTGLDATSSFSPRRRSPWGSILPEDGEGYPTAPPPGEEDEFGGGLQYLCPYSECYTTFATPAPVAPGELGWEVGGASDAE